MVRINEDPLDPNKDYTAEELANFIRRKILGVNTREAMARSLLKANEVAEWSEEVAQQLIDGSFDEGELNTEIERKLNELEQEYAPELTNVKSQLAETDEEVEVLKEGKIDKSVAATKLELVQGLNPKADQSYVDSILSGITDGSPKELFYSLNALNGKYPQGAIGPMLVFDSSHGEGAHAYIWDGEWQDIGLYQSEGLADGSVTTKKRTPLGSQAMLVGPYVRWDFIEKIVDLSGTTILFNGWRHGLGDDLVVDISSQVNRNYLVYNTDNRSFRTIPYDFDPKTLDQVEVIIASYHLETKDVDMTSAYYIDGVRREEFYQSYAVERVYFRNAEMGFSKDGNSVKVRVNPISSGIISVYYTLKNGEYGSSPLPADFEEFTLNHNQLFVYNYHEKRFDIKEIGAVLSPSDLILLSVIDGQIVGGWLNNEPIYDAQKIGFMVCPYGYPNFNFDDMTMTLPQGPYGNIHIYSGINYAEIPTTQDNVIDLSVTVDKGIITFDFLTEEFVCRPSIDIRETSSKEVLIAGFDKRGRTVTMVGNYTVDNVEIDVENDFFTSSKSTYKNMPAGTYWSDITFVGGEMWAFRESDGLGIAEDVGAIYIFNSNMGLVNRLTHNFGHVNSVEYNESTDSIIFGNGSGEYGTDGEFYVINKVKKWRGLEYDTFLDLSGDLQGSDITKYFVGREFGDKLNIVWGEDNQGHHNICYVISNDAQNFRKLLLGKGSGDLGEGQFISGLTSDSFNGSYKIIKEWSTPKIDVVQGGCYHNGYLYLGMGHGGLWSVRYKLNDDGSVDVEQRLEKFYDDDGEVISCASEGVTVHKGMVFNAVMGGVKAVYKYDLF